MTPDPVLRIVDAEAGGDVSRVIVAGAPALRGNTVAEQAADFAARWDHLRWKLMQPPVGELHMCPVLLLAPRDPGAELGVVIMESMGYPPISGSNLFCAAAVALETGIVAMREPGSALRIATPGGLATVRAWCRDGRCTFAEFDNAPAFVRGVIEVRPSAGSRAMTTRIVSAGVDYAVVPNANLPASLEAAQEALVETGRRISRQAGTDFVLFHEEIQYHGADARCRVAVFQMPSVICRSPTGTGTSALLALAHHDGRLPRGGTLAARSLTGGEFVGRILSVDAPGGPVTVNTAVGGPVRTGRTSQVP